MEDHNEKTSWPELKNTNVDQAVEKIRSENENLTVHKIESGSMVTMDYRTDRVRVFYDPVTNLVSKTPKVG